MKKLKKNYERNRKTVYSMNNCVCFCGDCPCGWEDYKYQYNVQLQVGESARATINRGNFL
ncbi:MAG: hypothetical protein KH896_06295 [Clostridiales bacterium]|nr:hypothetical protein [Clostridiales bacterium]